MPEPSTDPAGQAPTGLPQPGQQAPVQPVPENPPAQPPAPSAQEPAALQQQFETQRAQLEEQLRQAQETSRYHQSNADKYRNAAITALNGQPGQPAAPQEPWKPYAQQLQAEGVRAEEATLFAKSHYRMMQDEVAPLRQELQQSRMAVQIEPQIAGALNNLATQSPALFATPGVYETAKFQAQQFVQNGGNIDARFIEQLVVLAGHELSKGRQQQPIPTQPTPVPNAFQNGAFRPTTGFTPPAATQPQVSAEKQQAADWVAERLKITK